MAAIDIVGLPYKSVVTYFVDIARLVCGRVYVKVRCPSVRPSVCLSHLSAAARRCGGFAAAGPADSRYRSIASGAAAARRTAANASSDALSADVGSWTRACTWQ